MTGDGKHGDPPRTRRRALAVLVALALGLGVAEVGTRAIAGAPWGEQLPILTVRSHPTRGWEMLPDEPHFTYHHRVGMNELGLRGGPVPEVKGDELRVLALGDSLVYGQGVADDQTVPHHLETILNDQDPAGRRWRVVNAGHRAYSTHQELALLEELGERIQPDLVLLFWYWNDLEERDVAATAARLEASGPIAFDTGEPMEGGARRVWQLKQLARRSALVMWLHDLSRQGQGGDWTDELVATGFVNLERHLVRFRTWCDAYGAPVAFVVVPDARVLLGDEATVPLCERAIEVARARGVPALDLLPPMRERFDGDPPVIPFDGHYLSEGNRVLAETTARFVLELLPR